jgi:hypothetical protein
LATTDTQHGFGAMAALPRVDRFCYFRTLLARVENVLEAATAPSPKTLYAMWKRQKPIKPEKMKIVRTISVLIFLFVTFNVANGQYRTVPKKMKVKEDYIHSPTTMTFPLVLFDNYWRKSVYSFDKQNQNIGVTYEKNFNGEVTTFTLYLYPAGEGTEGRLREEYSYAIESASYAMKQEGLRVEQRAVKHEGEKYICKGIRAIFNNDNNDLSQITLFESGIWFYKIRITTNQKDKIFLLNLEREIIK